MLKILIQKNYNNNQNKKKKTPLILDLSRQPLRQSRNFLHAQESRLRSELELINRTKRQKDRPGHTLLMQNYSAGGRGDKQSLTRGSEAALGDGAQAPSTHGIRTIL
jgi:hypothetical protein